MTPFDPYDYQEPVRALVQEVRGLTIGQSISLVGGTVVKSVAMRHGATHARRFAVKSGSSKGTVFITAEEAAEAAIKGDK